MSRGSGFRLGFCSPCRTDWGTCPGSYEERRGTEKDFEEMLPAQSSEVAAAFSGSRRYLAITHRRAPWVPWRRRGRAYNHVHLQTIPFVAGLDTLQDFLGKLQLAC